MFTSPAISIIHSKSGEAYATVSVVISALLSINMHFKHFQNNAFEGNMQLCKMQLVTFGKFGKTFWPSLQNFLTIAWSTSSTNWIKKLCFVKGWGWKIATQFWKNANKFNLPYKSIWVSKNRRTDCNRMQRGLFKNWKISLKISVHFIPRWLQHSANKGN